MRVLLLDDDDALNSAIGEILLDDGFETECVRTDAEARGALQRGQFEVVVLDWLLGPGETAAALVDFIATLPSPPRIVLMSATPNVAPFAHQRRIPFLTKPFDADVLIAVVRDAGAGRVAG